MGKLDITGHAKFHVEPDTATIAILIEGRDFDYTACANEINRRTQTARRVLTSEGVTDDLIRSHDYRIEKVSEWHIKQFPGTRFYGKHDLRIRLPLDRDQVNRLLAVLTSADEALEISLGYEVRDLAVHRDKADALAVADALRRAGIIAEAAACRVIGIRSIRAGVMMGEQHSKDGYDQDLPAFLRPQMCAEESALPSPEVAPKMLGVSASIFVRVEIAAQNAQ
jgi:uncharacterized protein YggE